MYWYSIYEIVYGLLIAVAIKINVHDILYKPQSKYTEKKLNITTKVQKVLPIIKKSNFKKVICQV